MNEPTTIATKTCTRCKLVLPLSDFGSHAGKGDGLTSRCRTCKSELYRIWRKAHPEQVNAYKRVWRARKRYPVSVTEQQCNYCHEVKPADNFHRNARRASGLSAKCKDCRREWVQAHKPLWCDYASAHRCEGPKPDRLAVYAREGGRCHICARPVPIDNFHLEHLWPVAHQGDNQPANLAIAHPTCNLRKHAHTQPVQLRLA